MLIGAAAMGFHGLIRATEDLDLFIRATPENIERLRTALRHAYEGDPHINAISSGDLLGEYPVVRYYPPTGDIYFGTENLSTSTAITPARSVNQPH